MLPVHIHVTYTMGADFGKLFRLKEAGLWIDAPLEGRAEGAKAPAQAPGAVAAVAADGRRGGRPSNGFVKVTWALIASSD